MLCGTYYAAVTRLKDMPVPAFIESTRLTGKLAFMLVCCGRLSALYRAYGRGKFIRKASRPL